MNRGKAILQVASGQKEYRYTQEISQMMFVFGEVQDPDVQAVNLVEDIVRGQVLELVIQARALCAKRGARHISAEDLIFLIRHDRAKVNRLRTYMSWKDVRKNAKEDGKDTGGVEDGLDDNPEEHSTAKPRKQIIKLSWEVSAIYSNVIKTLADKHPGRHSAAVEDEDEDEQEAHEDDVKRLREADEVTRHMTKEEYMHYSECRQASFTYRKAKRFKEYLNLPPQFELRQDDTIDVLGFLAFEMVRSLTIRALEVKKSLEDADFVHPAAAVAAAAANPSTSVVGLPGGISSPVSPPKRKIPPEDINHSLLMASPNKRQRTLVNSPLPILPGLPASSKAIAIPGSSASLNANLVDEPSTSTWNWSTSPVQSSLFHSPPEARTPLTSDHIQDAFTRMQRDWAHVKAAGMRNWRRGLVKTKVSLI